MTSSPDVVAFFAYGAKMRAAAMDECGIAPKARERARLDDFALAFDLRGIPLVEPAFASIAPQPGARVHGVLWWVTPREAKRLDQFESSDYDAVEVEVLGESSGRVKAKAYRSRKPLSGLRPSRRYLGLLALGAREAGLPEEYVKGIEAEKGAYVPGVSELATLTWRGYLAVLSWRSRRR